MTDKMAILIKRVQYRYLAKAAIDRDCSLTILATEVVSEWLEKNDRNYKENQLKEAGQNDKPELVEADLQKP